MALRLRAVACLWLSGLLALALASAWLAFTPVPLLADEDDAASGDRPRERPYYEDPFATLGINGGVCSALTYGSENNDRWHLDGACTNDNGSCEWGWRIDFSGGGSAQDRGVCNDDTTDTEICQEMAAAFPAICPAPDDTDAESGGAGQTTRVAPEPARSSLATWSAPPRRPLWNVRRGGNRLIQGYTWR